MRFIFKFSLPSQHTLFICTFTFSSHLFSLFVLIKYTWDFPHSFWVKKVNSLFCISCLPKSLAPLHTLTKKIFHIQRTIIIIHNPCFFYSVDNNYQKVYISPGGSRAKDVTGHSQAEISRCEEICIEQAVSEQSTRRVSCRQQEVFFSGLPKATALPFCGDHEGPSLMNW